MLASLRNMLKKKIFNVKDKKGIFRIKTIPKGRLEPENKYEKAK